MSTRAEVVEEGAKVSQIIMWITLPFINLIVNI